MAGGGEVVAEELGRGAAGKEGVGWWAGGKLKSLTADRNQ